MPHIEDWVEPLMVAPALCLGVLDSSRMGQTFPGVPARFCTASGDFRRLWRVLEGSGEFWKALEGPSRLWRLSEQSGHNWLFLGETGGVWTSGGCV